MKEKLDNGFTSCFNAYASTLSSLAKFDVADAEWDVLGSDRIDVLNASFEGGSLPSSMRKSLITFIFKKGDRLERRHWWNISLLNIDYKLCTWV